MVLQSLRKIERKMKEDARLRTAIESFRQQLGSVGDNVLVLRLSSSSMRLLTAIHETRPQGERVEDTASSLLTFSLNNFESKRST